MFAEVRYRKDLPPPKGEAQAWNQSAAPPVVVRSHLVLVLSLASVLGLVSLILFVTTLTKWNVPLPRCAFKAVTGFPCFTCGSTRAILALGRLELFQAFQFNPFITLACVAVPVWLGVALIRTTFASRLRLRLPVRVKSVLLLLAAAVIGNWIYLLLALPE